MAKLVKIPSKVFALNNCPTCVKYEFTREGLDAVAQKYHEGRGQPAFMEALLHLNPESRDVALLKQHPELIKWSDDGSFVIIPDDICFDGPDLNRDKRLLRQDPEGMSFNAWYIHPKQLEETVFSDKSNRDDFNRAIRSSSYVPALEPKTMAQRDGDQKRIREIETHSGVPYLASVFDLTPAHVPWLKSLKKTATRYLADTYGADAKDHVDMYFHSILAEKTATLHLHIRLNQGLHPLEEQRRFYLDDTIKTLEEGKSVKDLVLKRGPVLNCDDISKMRFFQEIPGVTLMEIDNPAMVQNPYVAPRPKRHERVAHTPMGVGLHG